jgi:hypothetical protein
LLAKNRISGDLSNFPPNFIKIITSNRLICCWQAGLISIKAVYLSQTEENAKEGTRWFPLFVDIGYSLKKWNHWWLKKKQEIY